MGLKTEKVFIGLDNFISLLHDKTFLQALGNTMLFLLLGGVLIFSIALLFTYLITRPGFRGRKAFSTFSISQYDFSGRVGRAMGIFLQSGVWPFEYGAGSDRFGRNGVSLVGLSHGIAVWYALSLCLVSLLWGSI